MTPTATARPRNRAEIDVGHKWNLDDIYTDWETWERARVELEQRIGEYAALKGTLAQGPERLLAAMQLNDRLGQLAYKVYLYPSLKYDEDQRDNQVNARRQQVQALVAKWQQATSAAEPAYIESQRGGGLLGEVRRAIDAPKPDGTAAPVQGPLPDQEAAIVIKRNLPAVKACYEVEERAGTVGSGKAIVSLEIDPAGTVQNVSVDAPALS